MTDLRAAAERIRSKVMDYVDREGEIDTSEINIVDDNIESILREVVENEKEIVIKAGGVVAHKVYAKGRSEALEQAIQIVYKHSEGKWGASQIIDEIRALKP